MKCWSSSCYTVVKLSLVGEAKPSGGKRRPGRISSNGAHASMLSPLGQRFEPGRSILSMSFRHFGWQVGGRGGGDSAFKIANQRRSRFGIRGSGFRSARFGMKVRNSKASLQIAVGRTRSWHLTLGTWARMRQNARSCVRVGNLPPNNGLLNPALGRGRRGGRGNKGQNSLRFGGGIALDQNPYVDVASIVSRL